LPVSCGGPAPGPGGAMVGAQAAIRRVAVKTTAVRIIFVEKMFLPSPPSF
jgi:hypothetical protein